MDTLWIRNTALVLALLAGPAILWYASTRDPHRAFKAIAYPCLPLDRATTDPTDFVMVSGLRAPPVEHTMPDGSVVYPVFSHPDPAVVPRVGGKVLYFPARFIEPYDLETPPLPPAGRPLAKEHRFELVRYLGDDTRAELEAAIEGAKE